MKKIISAVLAVCLAFSLFSFSVYAETTDEEFAEIVKQCAEKVPDEIKNSKSDDIKAYLLFLFAELYNRKELSINQIIAAYHALGGSDSTKSPAPTQKEYSFGQGTYIVGSDLQAGTYDIVCESTANDSYTDSMNDFSGLYSDFGLGDYFNALGGMMESFDKMSVKLINSKGWTDKYLDLKAGESARIILEDGMKLDITNGSAKLVFVR